jgi:hypothetical protein
MCALKRFPFNPKASRTSRIKHPVSQKASPAKPLKPYPMGVKEKWKE